MSIVSEIYMGHHTDEDFLKSLREWIKECLDKKVDCETFENEWCKFVDAEDDCDENSFVPGSYYTDVDGISYWIDAMDAVEMDQYELANFYRKCYIHGANYIRIYNNNAYYSLIGETRGTKSKKKTYEKTKIVTEINRFEIMDLE